MPEVHSTSIIDERATLADDVRIGPNCVIMGEVTLGPGTILIGNVYLHGPLTIGQNNVIYPFACLGFAPQHADFDPHTPGLGAVIGDRNTFREHSTVHRAFTDEGPTRIGNDNVFMANSHTGHDCQIGNNCTFASSGLGGHCVVEDRVTVGGGTGVHQFVHLGEGAMLSGALGTSLDVPPWFMLTGISVCGSINIVGLRRSGMPRENIDRIRWVYRTLYRQGLSMTNAVKRLREQADCPIVQQYVDFIEGSQRGICHGVDRPARRIG